MTPDRTTDPADILRKTLFPKQRSKVRAVCMAMWQAYETSTETNAPNALSVYDRFQISKYLNETVDKVRRAEHREQQQTGDDRLKGLRQTLLCSPENLSDEMGSVRGRDLGPLLGETSRICSELLIRYESAMLKIHSDRMLTWLSSHRNNRKSE